MAKRYELSDEAWAGAAGGSRQGHRRQRQRRGLSAPANLRRLQADDMADQGAKAFAARDGEVEALRVQLAESHALLQRCVMAVREQYCDEGGADFDLPVDLMTGIDAVLDANADKECLHEPMQAGASRRRRCRCISTLLHLRRGDCRRDHSGGIRKVECHLPGHTKNLT